MVNVKIKKTEGAEESAELLAASIVQVSDGFEALMKAGLNRSALRVLIRNGIGWNKITGDQVDLVLDALPRLKGWYIRS
jgi:hypothetical protein